MSDESTAVITNYRDFFTYDPLGLCGEPTVDPPEAESLVDEALGAVRLANHSWPVAQLAERCTVNAMVAGSSPAGPANLRNHRTLFLNGR